MEELVLPDRGKSWYSRLAACFWAFERGPRVISEADLIGSRGEILFEWMITKWCDDKQWFLKPVHLGEKKEDTDYLVTLVQPSTEAACCYVQVKTTRKGYVGVGKNRKLRIRVTKKTIQRLRKYPYLRMWWVST